MLPSYLRNDTVASKHEVMAALAVVVPLVLIITADDRVAAILGYCAGIPDYHFAEDFQRSKCSRCSQVQ